MLSLRQLLRHVPGAPGSAWTTSKLSQTQHGTHFGSLNQGPSLMVTVLAVHKMKISSLFELGNLFNAQALKHKMTNQIMMMSSTKSIGVSVVV